MSWQMVDEGWGRRAVDWATLAEPHAVREYVFVHRLLDVRPGVGLLDVACGAGLSLELAGVAGATCSGIDASQRLVDVARMRNPGSDIRVGDMADSGFDDASFDLVTSFRGIWGTTPAAISEVARVLRPGGKVALTFWGDMAASPGGRLLAPFRLARQDQIDHQSDMVALKRPGAATAFLASAGLDAGELIDVPFVMEYADAEHYVRGLAASGPAYEAIQTVGEQAFHDACLEAVAPFLREGLPVRAELRLFGVVGTKPT